MAFKMARKIKIEGKWYKVKGKDLVLDSKREERIKNKEANK